MKNRLLTNSIYRNIVTAAMGCNEVYYRLRSVTALTYLRDLIILILLS